MGGGTPRAAHQAPLAAPTLLLPPCVFLRHSCVLHRHPAPLSVIPAQAGTYAPPTPRAPFPNSSLPPSRGEVRWGVERREPRTKLRSQRRPSSRHTCALLLPYPRPPSSPCVPLRHSVPPSVIPAQAGTTEGGQFHPFLFTGERPQFIPPPWKGGGMNWGRGVWVGVGGAAGSCLRRNDGESDRGVEERSANARNLPPPT